MGATGHLLALHSFYGLAESFQRTGPPKALGFCGFTSCVLHGCFVYPEGEVFEIRFGKQNRKPE